MKFTCYLAHKLSIELLSSSGHQHATFYAFLVMTFIISLVNESDFGIDGLNCELK